MNNQSRTKENPLIHATPEIKTSQKQNKSHYYYTSKYVK